MTLGIMTAIPITALLTMAGIIWDRRQFRFRLAGAVIMAAAIMVVARFAAAAVGPVVVVVELMALAAAEFMAVADVVNDRQAARQQQVRPVCSLQCHIAV